MGLVFFLGQDFFPDVDAGQMRLHVRARAGLRVEETARLCDEIENYLRQQIPKDELNTILDNIGLPYSGINLSYSNSGVIGTSDAEILVGLESGTSSSRRQTTFVACASSCRGNFPAWNSISSRPTSFRRF